MAVAKHVFLIAGEASGDLLGARLIADLKARDANLYYSGIGGPKMQQAGCKIILPSEQLAVMGLWEVLIYAFTIFRALQLVKRYLITTHPDLIVLIDFAGFNLKVAKIAQALNIKVLFYVSPKIWAWNYRRIHKIKQFVNHMAVLFPFEVALYQQVRLPVTFVGHPLTEMIPEQTPASLLPYQNLKLNPNLPVIGILPGSRKQEIKYLMPTLIATCEIIQQQLPGVQFVLPLAPTLDRKLFDSYKLAHIKIITQDAHTVLPLCHAAIICSGTATLETALFKVPMVIVYRMNWLSYLLARLLVKVKFIGLCNIVAQREVAKEFIQQAANPKSISEEIVRLIKKKDYRAQRIALLMQVRRNLTEGVQAQPIAELANKLLKNSFL